MIAKGLTHLKLIHQRDVKLIAERMSYAIVVDGKKASALQNYLKRNKEK